MKRALSLCAQRWWSRPTLAVLSARSDCDVGVPHFATYTIISPSLSSSPWLGNCFANQEYLLRTKYIVKPHGHVAPQQSCCVRAFPWLTPTLTQLCHLTGPVDPVQGCYWIGRAALSKHEQAENKASWRKCFIMLQRSPQNLCTMAWRLS